MEENFVIIAITIQFTVGIIVSTCLYELGERKDWKTFIICCLLGIIWWITIPIIVGRTFAAVIKDFKQFHKEKLEEDRQKLNDSSVSIDEK